MDKRYDYKILKNHVEVYFKNKKGMEFTVYMEEDSLKKMTDFKYKFHVCWSKSGYYLYATEYLGKKEGKYKYQTIKFHRFIMNAEKGQDVDHKNHNTLDNRRKNLRLTDRKQNSKHRGVNNSNNKSGYRNVCWDSKNKKWLVQLQVNGKNTRLGRFDDVHEAGKFAKEMREKYYGEFAGRKSL